MGMFDAYDNLQDNYIPNNIKREPPKCPESKLDPCRARKPYEEYNVEGELVGYYWYYGDTITLEFNITGDIIVEDDAIVYYAIGQEPTIKTEGKVGQKAYNIVDSKSWTCIAIDFDLNGYRYIWREDEEFSNPVEGSRSVYVSASDFLRDKEIDVQLFNFRRELITKKTYAGSSQIKFEIDKELSNQLVRGVYYISLTVWSGDDLSKTVYQQEDCTLTVK